MRYLFAPVWQQARNHLPDVWWNHFKRITLAFQGLKCEELLR